MNFLIVEDEEQAAKRLIRLIRKVEPKAFIHGPLETISDTIKWMEANPVPDLIFLDIHLADGLSFEIFNRVRPYSPIVFTTAYDQYAIRAFKYNSIHYLLKPIEEPELTEALNKFKKAELSEIGVEETNLVEEDMRSRYKKRFISKIGDRLEIILVGEIDFVFSENKGTYLKLSTGKTHLVDHSLEVAEEMLNPDSFFRLNRKYIAHIDAVTGIRSYSNGRVKVELKNWPDRDIVLSRDKSRLFKDWINK